MRPVFKSKGIALVAALFVTVSVVAKKKEIVIEPSEGKRNAGLNWTNPVAPQTLPSAPKTNAPAVKPNPPTTNTVHPTSPPPPVATWDSLNQWATDHHLKAPQLFATAPEAAYAIESTNGTMVLGIGSREVTWNRVELNLGFAPQLIDGEVYIHGNDLKKNVAPLLLGPPLALPVTNRVIVVDPGHGGNNPGTVSTLDGRLEKEFTLDWALRLKPLLETNGWTVFLTRTNDSTVTNADRVVFADAHHADLYVSLHFNATGDRDPYTGGIETYSLTPTGLPSTLTRNYADPWYAVYPGNQFDVPNLQLAVLIQNALVQATRLEDRGAGRARFMTVLQGQHCPAILVEAGYLSNPRDAKLIESPDYRQKLAETIANTLK